MSKTADLDEIMYSCGLEMLHPGGLEKTDEMARICQIGADKTLLDIGAGRYTTTSPNATLAPVRHNTPSIPRTDYQTKCAVSALRQGLLLRSATLHLFFHPHLCHRATYSGQRALQASYDAKALDFGSLFRLVLTDIIS